MSSKEPLTIRTTEYGDYRIRIEQLGDKFAAWTSRCDGEICGVLPQPITFAPVSRRARSQRSWDGRRIGLSGS